MINFTERNWAIFEDDIKVGFEGWKEVCCMDLAEKSIVGKNTTQVFLSRFDRWKHPLCCCLCGPGSYIQTRERFKNHQNIGIRENHGSWCDPIKKTSKVKDNAGVEGGDDDGSFHKSALKVPEEKMLAKEFEKEQSKVRIGI